MEYKPQDLSSALRLYDLCQAIPYNMLDLENGYTYYDSLEALRNAASGENYCQLCQMMWESIMSKKQRINLGMDPILKQKWPIILYAISTLPGQASFRGYQALELRSGERVAGTPDSTWWTFPSGSLEPIYPIVSRIYLHATDYEPHVMLYARICLDDAFSIGFECAKRWLRCRREFRAHQPLLADPIVPTRLINVDPSLPRPRFYSGW
jgi:hypothetical protein